MGNEAGANGKDAQLAQDTTAHAEPGFLIPRGVLQDDSLEGPAPVQSTVHHRLILGGLMYMIQVLEHV